jgi:FAD/FMN-containing dehydrogenase
MEPTPRTGTTPTGSSDPRALREALRGPLIEPGDRGYDAARRVYNAMIDRRPRAIARCVDVADVVACVRFARERGLTVAVRGGGHSVAGLGVADDALVIDLALMRGVRVDPRLDEVRVEGGCTWGDVDHATHAFGLAVPSGIISTTGVGGLTLGGGTGHLSRRYGLTIDNLRSVDLVTADGGLVTASEEDYPDLFWAVRGGGGNFGVATSFVFRAHPVREVIGGPVFFRADRAREVLRFYRDFLPAASLDLSAFFAFLTVPSADPFPAALRGQVVCGVVLSYLGPERAADRALAPLRALRPDFEHVGKMPYPALQSMFDALYPPGLQMYWRGDFVRAIPDEAIEAHLQYGAHPPTPLSTMHLYPIDGAVHRVAEDATAFRFRDATFSQVIVGADPSPDRADDLRGWVRPYHDALHPHSAGAGYVNFLMGDESSARVRATYGANHARLEAMKRRYDPENFFHVNQNIRPAASGASAGGL